MSHVCSAELPNKALIPIAKDVYVCSPALCFATMGCDLSPSGLIRLGFELCGSYSLPPSGIGAFASRPPLTNTEEIAALVSHMGGARGARTAASALRHIIDRSASPMETNCAMFYSLPLKKGGCSLSAPKMNHRINVPDGMRQLIGKGYFLCDLYWEKARLDVEYDSESHHATRSERTSDAIRRNALSAMGVSVITLTADQILDFDLAWASALNISHMLHERIRVAKNDPLHAQRKLHRELFGPK